MKIKLRFLAVVDEDMIVFCNGEELMNIENTGVNFEDIPLNSSKWKTKALRLHFRQINMCSCDTLIYTFCCN